MTKATNLAMELAQIKLKVVQVTKDFKGNNDSFDRAILQAICELNKAIFASPDAVTKR